MHSPHRVLNRHVDPPRHDLRPLRHRHATHAANGAIAAQRQPLNQIKCHDPHLTRGHRQHHLELNHQEGRHQTDHHHLTGHGNSQRNSHRTHPRDHHHPQRDNNNLPNSRSTNHSHHHRYHRRATEVKSQRSRRMLPTQRRHQVTLARGLPRIRPRHQHRLSRKTPRSWNMIWMTKSSQTCATERKQCG